MSKVLGKRTSKNAHLQKDTSSSEIEDEQPITSKNLSSAWGKLLNKSHLRQGASKPKKTKLPEPDIIEQDSPTTITDPIDVPEMKNVKSLFGMDVEKLIEAKRKKLDNITKEIVENHQARVEKLMQVQWEEQNAQFQKLSVQTSDAMEKWEKILKTVKEQETKSIKLFEQHIKTINQMVQQEVQRMQSLSKQHDLISKSIIEIETKQKEGLKALNSELKLAIAKAHKKVSQDSAQKALANAHKSFFSSF